ncbi:MAG: hypothetical protein CSB06_01170 [Bacteroidia bacterium]|nr:MAG: hypothetical protein CSB06_01170 [Bacteroidia bacterium]
MMRLWNFRKKKYKITLPFFVSFLCLTASSFTIQAQDNLRFGVLGGGNYCRLTGPDKPSEITKPWGYSAGVYFDIRMGHRLSVLPELKYAHYSFSFFEKGYMSNQVQTRRKIEQQAGYLQVPFFVKYKWGEGSTFFHTQVGMQASLLLHNKLKTGTLIKGKILTDPYYANFQSNKFDFGIAAGLGVQLMLFNLDLNYYFSTVNVFSQESYREFRYGILSLDLGVQINYKSSFVYDKRIW